MSDDSLTARSAGTEVGSDANKRALLLAHALRLEYLTVAWDILEGAVAMAAALGAGSVVLIGFAVDSFVESASGGVLIWRLLAEWKARDHEEIERLDRRARKLVAVSLFGLAAYLACDAAQSLWVQEQPRPSVLGLVVTAASLGVMMWLAHAKRRAARDLGSRALESDAVQTMACWWLSAITLVGVGLNMALGWWWADPVAALGMVVFLAREGREAWRGEECC